MNCQITWFLNTQLEVHSQLVVRKDSCSIAQCQGTAGAKCVLVDFCFSWSSLTSHDTLSYKVCPVSNEVAQRYSYPVVFLHRWKLFWGQINSSWVQLKLSAWCLLGVPWWGRNLGTSVPFQICRAKWAYWVPCSSPAPLQALFCGYLYFFLLCQKDEGQVDRENDKVGETSDEL